VASATFDRQSVAVPQRDAAELTFENGLVLDAIQALVGSISENFLAISLEADLSSESVIVHFALAEESDTDREEIEEDFPVELIAPGGRTNLDVRTEIWIGSDIVRDRWPGLSHRMLFARRSI
jgi:hypothetical protein